MNLNTLSEANDGKKDNSVDLKDIKAIIELMRKNSVSEFELEKQDFKIRLKRGPNGGVGGATSLSLDDVVPLVQPATVLATVPGVVPAKAAVPTPASTEVDIKSPMIGTFYRAPSPE